MTDDKVEELYTSLKELSKDINKRLDVNETLDKKICPRCGSELVLRTAKRGAHAGEQFYGCSSFPKCRYMQF